MRTLSETELEYIVTALDFQLENDDDSNPPPVSAGESALAKLAELDTTNITIVFSWSQKHGECYDCGLPAAFYEGDAPTDATKYCAVCAANLAADGVPIRRIEEN